MSKWLLFKYATKKPIIDILMFIDSNLYSYINIPKKSLLKQNRSLIIFLIKLITLANKNNINFWVNGSTAVSFYNGSFFKKISDLDLTFKNKVSEEKMEKLLKSIGFKTISKRKRGAIKMYSNKYKLEVDLGQINIKNGLFYKAKLNNYFTTFNGISLRLINAKDLIKAYIILSLTFKRSIKQDLIKIKILKNAANTI